MGATSARHARSARAASTTRQPTQLRMRARRSRDGVQEPPTWVGTHRSANPGERRAHLLAVPQAGRHIRGSRHPSRQRRQSCRLQPARRPHTLQREQGQQRQADGRPAAVASQGAYAKSARLAMGMTPAIAERSSARGKSAKTNAGGAIFPHAAVAAGKSAIINCAFGSLLVLLGTPIYFFYKLRKPTNSNAL